MVSWDSNKIVVKRVDPPPERPIRKGLLCKLDVHDWVLCFTGGKRHYCLRCGKKVWL